MDKKVTGGNSPYLIVGLGNPGPRYAHTRHNAGFMVMDELARKHGLKFSGKQGNAEVAKGEIAGEKVIVAKPQTFMNNSGQAVRFLAGYYKVPNERVLVVYDEIALPVGTIRIREKGSSAGHNGVKSLIQHMGTESIPRIRFGVDRPADPRHSQIDWVLGRFDKDEKAVVEQTISRTVEAIESLLTIGIERTMNSFNTGPAGDEKNEGRREKPPASKASTKAPEPTPKPKVEDDLSMDAIRQKIARIIHGNE